jgi:hypothetical protein
MSSTSRRSIFRALRSLLCAALLAAAWSCAPRASYRADYPLTGQEFESRDSNFRGRVPSGWMLATGRENDSLAPSLAALLIKEDYSATLSFREIRLDGMTLSLVRKEGLPALARATQSFHGAVNPAPEIEAYELHGLKVCGYETGGVLKERVCVFGARGGWYECTVKATKPAAEAGSLFVVQQSVLASLAF